MSRQLDHYYRKRSAMIDAMGGRCVDCLSTSDLEFDHQEPSKKEFDISVRWGLSMDNLRNELSKCVLRCSPCHLEKTKNIDGIKSVHGMYSMYRHGKCRCDLCKLANREQSRKNRAKKN